MDEATPHLHIDFIPFTTGSKRGLSTRVSLKQALADQGITGEGRSLTERDLWVQKEKEALAAIMLEHGIEWEQKGEHKEHLSVLEFKREKRKEEIAELEQTLECVQQKQVSVQAVEQIEAKPLPLTSKVAVEREDYQTLVTAAQKYVVQEKQEGKLKKLLKEAKRTIADMKAKIESLVAELTAVKEELAQYKSVRGQLRTADLEQENDRLRKRIRTYEDVISRNNLWNYEVLKTPQKDIRMRQYMDLFLGYYTQYGMNGLTEYIKNSQFQEEQIIEQRVFAENEIRNPEQYDYPPESVEILTVRQFERAYHPLPDCLSNAVERIVAYNIGMNYIRSDPYAGMSALYYYLYCDNRTAQILLFPNILMAEWDELGRNTKTYRMFKEFGDAILFQDGLLLRDEL